MTTENPPTSLRLTVTHAPFAGNILDGDQLVPLVVRFDQIAITADGRMVMIYQAAEWIDDTFQSWDLLEICKMGPDRMRSACALVEAMLLLRPGTLSAESLEPAIQVAAACVAGSLNQIRQRFNLWPISPQ